MIALNGDSESYKNKPGIDAYKNSPDIYRLIYSSLETITGNFSTVTFINENGKYIELQSILLEINDLCKTFRSLEFQNVPEPILRNNIFPLLNKIQDLHKKLIDSPNQLLNSVTRKQFYDDTLALYTEAYNLLTPSITYFKMINLNADGSNIEKKFNQLFEKFQSEQEQFLAKGKDIEEKQRLLLEQSEKLTENLGISSYAEYFKEEAADHNKISRVWVLITFLLAASIVYFALYAHTYLPNIPGDSLTPSYVSQVLAPKATILVILVYMLTWSVKNQKSHNHNYIVNKHRKNALETFQAFVLSSEGTPEIKQAMLMQMTNCIFNHQNSSYTATEKEPDIANKLLELVKPNAKGS